MSTRAQWAISGDVSKRHLAGAGETYLEHFAVAAGLASSLILSGLGCLIHAIFPGLLRTWASDSVESLHARLRSRRQPRDG
jgi:hypothetical protein